MNLRPLAAALPLLGALQAQDGRDNPPASSLHAPEPQWEQLRQACDGLDREVRAASLPQPEIKATRTAPPRWADVVIYQKAVQALLRFPEEVYRKSDLPDAIAAAADGILRAQEFQRGETPWTQARGAVALGYVSAVDGSVQPYGVWIPESYDPSQPARLDVILHGRNRFLNEVSFLASIKAGTIIRSETGRTTPPDVLKLYVFGRGNTSYRWAGETDVFEALADFQTRYRVDPDRIVLSGFSMGGTGAWHLGLHFPSRWAAVMAGAGYVQTRPEVLRTIHEPWRFESLAIHDAANCAINLTDVPFVAYDGDRDVQMEQNHIIQRNLAAEGIDFHHLGHQVFMIGEGVGHAYRPDRKRESDAFLAAALPRRRPDRFDFVCYTPAYGQFWDFHADTLQRLYQRAELRGTWDNVQTRNVWVLRLDQPRTLTLDGQRVEGAVFQRTAGGWQTGEPAGLRKRAGLQGPIDDAFQQPFLCVPPASGSDPVLRRFGREWARYLRGDLRIKSASEVTASDVAHFNLVLFGDPRTNPWIARVLPGLPLRWSEDEIAFAGHTFSARENTVAMIYPNPLNPSRYVVLNTGHTFPGTDFDNLHWYLHPRLGDFAVLDRATRAVRWAGFFDAAWQWPAPASP